MGEYGKSIKISKRKIGVTETASESPLISTNKKEYLKDKINKSNHKNKYLTLWIPTLSIILITLTLELIMSLGNNKSNNDLGKNNTVIREHFVTNFIYNEIDDPESGKISFKLNYKNKDLSFLFVKNDFFEDFDFKSSFTIYEYVEEKSYYFCPTFSAFSHEKIKYCYLLEGIQKENAIHMSGKTSSLLLNDNLVDKEVLKKEYGYTIKNYKYEETGPSTGIMMLFRIDKSKKSYYFQFDKTETLSKYDFSQSFNVHIVENIYHFCPSFKDFDKKNLTACHILDGEYKKMMRRIIGK